MRILYIDIEIFTMGTVGTENTLTDAQLYMYIQLRGKYPISLSKVVLLNTIISIMRFLHYSPVSVYTQI